MSNVKKMVVSSLLIAIGVALPLAFHSIPNAGGIFLPMHIPVLLCGMLCGVPYGLVCGIITPLLSSLLTGMPPPPMLPSMVCELAVYGTAAAALLRFTRAKNTYMRTYIALVGAMLSGRIVCGVLNALIFKAGNYSMQMWTASAFVTALPGIALQIILIPSVLIAIKRYIGEPVFDRQNQSSSTKDNNVVNQAINLIKSKTTISCVIIKGNEMIHTADGRGVSPLLNVYDSDPGKLKDSIVVDKIIGKAAAMILVLGGAKRVYGMIMSAAGRRFLEQHGISAECGRCVDMIVNRTSDGICPIERSVMDIDDPQEGLAVLKTTIDKLMKPAAGQ